MTPLEVVSWSQFHQHFTQKVFVQKYFAQLSLVTFQLCNFWRQNIGAKCTLKMLMKLTIGVNFINILLIKFSYISASHSFSLVAFWLCNFWRKNIGEKAAHKMLMKLTQR